MTQPRTQPRPAPRILVVEDEVHLADGLRYTLEAEGYEVELAYDGEAALALLLPGQQHPPDQPAPAEAGHGVAGMAHRLGHHLGTRLGPFLESRLGPRPALPPTAEDGHAPAPDPSLEAESPSRDTDFDAVLLDVMHPGRSGFEVVSALRAAALYIPVLMLTARGRPEDVLHGLEAGADDYLPKPFDLNILLARLRVLLRRVRWHDARTQVETAAAGQRPAEEGQPTYSFAGRTIDFTNLELSAKGTLVRLTLMEADFLRYLADNPFRIIPRKELLEQVWRVHEDTDTRAIDNFVVRLRRYLEDEPANPVYLKTVRGVGYRFLPVGE
ncbi:MAG TPA: response regulator transcription factor [Acidobacteriaceae bacterium]